MTRIEVIFVLGLLLNSFGANSQSPKAGTPVLVRKALSTTNNQNFKGFELLDQAVAQHQFFFLGEKHLQPGNYKGQLKFIRYLHTRGDLRLVAIERGMGVSILLQRYINSGEAKDLDNLQNFTFASNSFFKFAKRLASYNRSLPIEERLIVQGIDLENQSAAALKSMSLAFHDTPPPTELKEIVDRIRVQLAAKIITREAFDDLRDETLIALTPHPDLLRQWLGDNYPLVKQLLDGMAKSQTYYELRSKNMTLAYEFRETNLFEHFKNLAQQYPGQKIFAQMGQIHTLKTPIAKWEKLSNWKSLANRVDEGTSNVDSSIVCCLTYHYRYNNGSWDEVLFGTVLNQQLLGGSRAFLELVRLPRTGSKLPNSSPYFQFVVVNRYRKH